MMPNRAAENDSSDVPLWDRGESALRSLLWRVHPRRLDRALEWFLGRARKRAASVGLEQAIAEVYDHTRAEVIRRLVSADSRFSLAISVKGRHFRVERTRALLESQIPRSPPPAGPAFQCDASMGGLARWLRAAGHDAAWWPEIDDDMLLRKTLESCAVMLTTDRRLMRRGVVTRGIVPAVLVPVALDKYEQFQFLAGRLNLKLKPPRCMQCGGRLRPVEKSEVRDRIPPRTYPWLDDYFQCERCGRLFWKGTHWPSIAARLERIARTPP